MNPKTTCLVLIFTLLGTSTGAPAMTSKEHTNITIYSTHQHGPLNPHQLQNSHNIPGFATIRQNKEITFTSGDSQLMFDDVTEYIDPTTVSLKLSKKNQNKIKIHDQNFQFDLVDNNKLLQKYIGQNIAINHNLGDTSVNTNGTLLSIQGGLIIKQENNTIKTISTWNHITFDALPEGLLTRPTLIWKIESELSGPQPVTVSYQTQGMTWWADYNITLHENKKGCHLDLSSWVSIVNKSGANFHNSRLKLIAGDVNRVQPQQHNTRMAASKSFNESNMANESLFEYHMYRLPNLVDLPNHSTKQVSLMSQLNNITCSKILTLNVIQLEHISYHQPITNRNHYQTTKTNPTASLHFINSIENQLGIPFPAGRIRVNVLDKLDNSLEFIGEDKLSHTPKNEVINITLGKSFDVAGTRTQTEFKATKNQITETIEIHLSNQKSHDETIKVIEPMYRWSNWVINDTNHPYDNNSDNTIGFNITLKPESKKHISYTVTYQWNKD